MILTAVLTAELVCSNDMLVAFAEVLVSLFAAPWVEQSWYSQGAAAGKCLLCSAALCSFCNMADNHLSSLGMIHGRGLLVVNMLLSLHQILSYRAAPVKTASGEMCCCCHDCSAQWHAAQY